MLALVKLAREFGKGTLMINEIAESEKIPKRFLETILLDLKKNGYLASKLGKHWNFSGVHTGVFFGIPATGKTVSIDGVTLVRMSNGKIAEERDFFDNLDFMAQLGLMPAPGK